MNDELHFHMSLFIRNVFSGLWCFFVAKCVHFSINVNGCVNKLLFVVVCSNLQPVLCFSWTICLLLLSHNIHATQVGPSHIVLFKFLNAILLIVGWCSNQFSSVLQKTTYMWSSDLSVLPTSLIFSIMMVEVCQNVPTKIRFSSDGMPLKNDDLWKKFMGQ